MKKCSSCGNKVNDDSYYCANCGSNDLIFEQTYQPVYNNYVPPVNQKGNFAWAILGFCVPLAGFILYALWSNEKPKDAKMSLYGAIISTILGFIIVVLYIIFFILVFSSI